MLNSQFVIQRIDALYNSAELLVIIEFGCCRFLTLAHIVVLSVSENCTIVLRL